MTPDERKLLAELFDRVQSASGNRRDPEAEAFIAENVRAQPYAPYLLAQAVIVQEEGLRNAAARIEQLERELADAKASSSSSAGGGFLGSVFGGSRAPAQPPQSSQPAPGGPWGYQRASVPPSGPQAGAWGGQPQQGGWAGGQAMQPQMQGAQGGSFLRGALGAAAGVAGGMLLANSLSGLFKGDHNAHGIAGDTAGGAGSSLTSNDDSSITGGIFDDKPSSGPAYEDPQPASFDDDAGGWDSGGSDDSYDV